MYLIIDCEMTWPSCILGQVDKSSKAKDICLKLNKKYGYDTKKYNVKATFEDIEEERAAVYCYVEINKYE